MPNAIEMLRQDHEKVKKLFEEFESAGGSRAKKQIVEQTVRELETHATLEEEIFYPAAQEEIEEKESVDEAREEHHVVKLLLGELQKMSAESKRYDAKYKVLAENVKHHIQEEESELFPKLEGKLDAEELGSEMENRKQELQRQPRKRSRTVAKSRNRTRASKGRQTRSKKARRKVSGRRR